MSALQTQLRTTQSEIDQHGEGSAERTSAIDKEHSIQAQIAAIKAQEKAEKEYETTRKRVEELDNRANVWALPACRSSKRNARTRSRLSAPRPNSSAASTPITTRCRRKEKKNEADKLAKLDRSLNSAALREDSNRQGRLAQKDGGGDDPEAAYRAGSHWRSNFFKTVRGKLKRWPKRKKSRNSTTTPPKMPKPI